MGGLRNRVSFVLMGVVCIGAVVWTGFKARDDPEGWTIWFGLACALLAPAGLASFAYAIRLPERPLLRRLAAVPEIQGLIEQAESKQEEVELLTRERARLVEIVQLETRRQTLLERRTALVDEAGRVVGSLQQVDDEIARLGGEIQSSRVVPEVQALEAILEAGWRGDIVLRFGEAIIAVNPGLLNLVPAFGALAEAFVQLGRLFGELMRRSMTALLSTLGWIAAASDQPGRPPLPEGAQKRPCGA